MTNQGHLKALPDSEPSALKITTKSAFLACKTRDDASSSTSAQREDDHSRLQELHYGLTHELAKKEAQFQELKKTSARTQASWAERTLDLQRCVEAAHTALAQLESEHSGQQLHCQESVAELERKEAEVIDFGDRHQERVVELECKDSRIRDLEDTARSLAQKHSDAVRSTLAQHEAETIHHQKRYQTQSAELERKGARVLHRDRTIKSLTQENSDLKESAAGCQEALAEKSLDLQAATDKAHFASAQHELDQMLLQRLHRKHTDELRRKEAEALARQSTIEDLQQKNSDLETTVASVQKALVDSTRELQRATDAAKLSSAQTEAELSRLLDFREEQITVTQEHEARMRDLQCTIEDLSKKNSDLECKAASAQDAVARKTADLKLATNILSAEALARAAADRDVTRLSTTVETLETDTRRRTKQLNDATRTQARMDAQLKDALRLASRSQATIEALKRDNAVSSRKTDSLQRRRDLLATALARTNDANAKTKKDLQDATKTISELKTAALTAHDKSAVLAARLQQLEIDNQAHANREQTRLTQQPPVAGLPVQLFQNQEALPAPTAGTSVVHDDSELYHWNTAQASGIFECWANSLHGSEIMDLISIEADLPHLVDCILVLIFDDESH